MSESEYDDSDNEEVEEFTGFEENISDRLRDLIVRIDKNGDVSQARQRAVIQDEMEIPAESQGFRAGCTIRFAPENVRIRVDPKRGWDYEGPSADPPPPNSKTTPPPMASESWKYH